MNPRLMRPYKEGVPASLLLRFDGTNGSAVFTDSSPAGLTVTANGDAQISTAQSKWGGASGYFANAGYIETGTLFDFAASDWTIEFWLFADNTQLDKHIISNIGAATTGINIYLDSSGALAYNNGVATTTCATPFTAWDEWAHVALVRESGVISLFLNGVLAGEATSQTPGDTQYLRIGASLYTGYEFTGYIDDFRIVKGLAVYQGPFIPPSAPLSPYAKQVAVSREAELLLHFDGTNGSTTFTDSSVNAIALTGGLDTELTTANYKYGTAAVALNSTSIVSDVTGIVPDMSSGDWTLEAWVWRPSGIGNAAILNLQAPGGGPTGLHFWIGDDHQIRWDEGTQECAVGGSVPTEEWAHIAAVRFGGVTRLYLNGEQVGSQSSVAPIAGPYTVYIGQHGGNDFFSDMLIDDLRVVRGLAVYQGPFVPPTGPLPAIATPQPIQAQASLLLHFDGTNGSTSFVDSSPNALTVTAYGDAQISTAQSKFGGASGYFDGDGDYASVAGCDELASSWTVECWLHTPALAGTRAVVSKGAASDVSNCWSVEPDGNALGLYADIGNAIELIATSPEVPVNEWVHLAVVSNNGVVTLFVNGSGGSPSSQVSIASTLGADLIVGAGWYDPASRGFEGYIDDLRIVTGLAVYTGNFTPPAGPLSATVTPQ